MRQIVLDTETTGIDPKEGHRIIEIGCVEVVNRRLTGNHFHVYINPGRHIEQEAIEVHGITNEFLTDKPTFAQVAQEFVNFIKGAQLVIHNAPFDVGFMDHEFGMEPSTKGVITNQICDVLDTLTLARQMHPGQKNNLDALCKRYGIDNSHRTLHGALLDAEILADVYLLMTGGQTKLKLASSGGSETDSTAIRRVQRKTNKLKVIKASADELTQHEARLDIVEKAGGKCLWRPNVDEVS
ncbi:DNA polymerase III subunit epsilon [Alteromonas mediterranea]|jgi:DNA polymerase III subunit epsilon|uniref:DNA polymerase III subunit epsilon n=3 Tax=Alteromonas mediterranea TaxID=314275 RepID=A0AAC9NQP3_9ALTE|nr:MULTISPECIES: DNA polymerase III subunit epsilon [Alteromonas]AGP77799.1 DNA polymerase III subunit epsilon [Alteromonas mediterranea 615]AGP93366.1 DNA polymerase III subunit epsilon [Alteromonas mediterranea U8]MBR9896929.1 DNA polymerase III subunit epsilon [Gammaproteobacteria bacterium]MDY6882442.1 DNA polymerase III subunit epsilon [Pseudomonadota bacterium]AEA97853.1 DNA polymerase III subunit epsilon [Alteromonas mediterranea DE]|tara:strand:+ start:69 stop:788 length:720 start_codon:yes stop_codon:yes gene_type:complete